MTDWLNRSVFGYGVWPDQEKQITVNDKAIWLRPLTKEKQASIHVDLVSPVIRLEDAHSLINKFLSHLSWISHQPYWLGDGFVCQARNTNFDREQSMLFEGLIIDFPDVFELYDAPLVSKALAFYREAKVAEHYSLPYACLSYYKILEIEKKENSVGALDKWINVKLSKLQKDDQHIFKKLNEFTAESESELSKFFFSVIRQKVAHYTNDSDLNLDDDRENQLFQYAIIPLRDLATLYIKEVLNLPDSIFSKSYHSNSLHSNSLMGQRNSKKNS